MKKPKTGFNWLVSFILVATFLSACGSLQNTTTTQPIETPTATATIASTEAAVSLMQQATATQTPTPTSTPWPTSTSTPTPNATATAMVLATITQAAVNKQATLTAQPTPTTTPIPSDLPDANCIDLQALQNNPFKVGDTLCLEGVVGEVDTQSTRSETTSILFKGSEANPQASNVSNIAELVLAFDPQKQAGLGQLVGKRVRVVGNLAKGSSPLLWSVQIKQASQIKVVVLETDAKATAVALSGSPALTPTPVPLAKAPTATALPATVNSSDNSANGSGSNSSSTNTTRIGAVCNDGTTSTATGRGACSHHKGVAHWVYN